MCRPGRAVTVAQLRTRINAVCVCQTRFIVRFKLSFGRSGGVCHRPARSRCAVRVSVVGPGSPNKLAQTARTAQRAFFDLSPNRPTPAPSTGNTFVAHDAPPGRRCPIFAPGPCQAAFFAPSRATQQGTTVRHSHADLPYQRITARTTETAGHHSPSRPVTFEPLDRTPAGIHRREHHMT